MKPDMWPQMLNLTIAIPDSVLRDAPDLRTKTTKAGEIARAFAVHRVTNVVIYHDPIENVPSSEKNLLISLLRYIETPQYLRKLLFPLQKQLRYAGLLPPLATPHHPIISRLSHFKDQEIREGVITKSQKQLCYVDVGAEESIRLIGTHDLSIGDRVTVKVDKKQKTAIMIPNSEVESYWGFHLAITNKPLGAYMQQITPNPGELRLATSRTGISIIDLRYQLPQRLFLAPKIIVAFGSPKFGISELLSH